MVRLTLALASLAVLLVQGVQAADLDPGPVKVALKPMDLALASHRTVGGGLSLRSVPAKDAPLGFDTMFTGMFGPVAVRFLHKGWAKDQVRLFWWPDQRNPIEIPRLEPPTSDYYLAFGPVKISGLPPVSLHFYFPAQTAGFENWKKQDKSLMVLTMQCLAGEAVIGGKKILVGLLDRNVNSCASDPCSKDDREGDWILCDNDGDGKFAAVTFNGEARALTKFVPLAGRVWSVACAGRDLVLKPVSLPKCRVRIAGLPGTREIHGWSFSTGQFDAALDQDGSAEIPKDRFQPWSYDCTVDEWRLNGRLRNLGCFDPPASGSKTIEAGPKLSCELTKVDQPEGMRFEYRCYGRAKESVTLTRKGKTILPCFVVSDASGKEVFRKEQGFG